MPGIFASRALRARPNGTKSCSAVSGGNPMPLSVTSSVRAFPARESEIQIGAGSGEYFRSEEHTSELQSLMRISYAVFCLKKKKTHYKNTDNTDIRRHKT